MGNVVLTDGDLRAVISGLELEIDSRIEELADLVGSHERSYSDLLCDLEELQAVVQLHLRLGTEVCRG